MNNQMIGKIIKFNNKKCPEFVFDNPLLDKNVARELAKSFIKILGYSSDHSTTNNNLRYSILENIRKLLQIQPEGHAKVDDNFVEMINKLYKLHLEEITSPDNPEASKRKIDSFLLKKFNSLNLELEYTPVYNAEIIQALINLNEHGVFLDKLSNEIVLWNRTDCNKLQKIIKNIWSNNSSLESLFDPDSIDEVAIKMKAEIEKTLLESTYFMLTNKTDITEYLTTNLELKDLAKKCSISGECFHICSGILNFLLILTDFDATIKTFIPSFIENVKGNLPNGHLPVIYPLHMQTVAILMDMPSEELTADDEMQVYVDATIKYLNILKAKSEHDFILIMSHYPAWFPLYYKDK